MGCRNCVLGMSRPSSPYRNCTTLPSLSRTVRSYWTTSPSRCLMMHLYKDLAQGPPSSPLPSTASDGNRGQGRKWWRVERRQPDSRTGWLQSPRLRAITSPSQRLQLCVPETGCHCWPLAPIFSPSCWDYYLPFHSAVLQRSPGTGSLRSTKAGKAVGSSLHPMLLQCCQSRLSGTPRGH